LNGVSGEKMSAFAPSLTVWPVTPTLFIVPPVTIFPAKMPIEPVSVAGCATIVCAGMAM
jgi:hypothetical protein